MAQYVVSGAYATMRVRDENDAETLVGLYRNAPVPSGITDDSRDHLLSRGLIEKAEQSADGESKPPKVADVLAEVGDDKDKAAEALEQEKARGDAARSTLVERLQAVVDSE